MDHPLEGQPAGCGDHRAARGERPARGDDAVGLDLQLRAGGARDDRGDPAAVRKLAVRRVDDRVDRLLEQVAANDVKEAPGS